MDLVVIDDSKQKKPSRDGMGSLIGVGGFHLPSSSVRNLTLTLDAICDTYGFPSDEEFKWSPDRRTWMRRNLQDARRSQFFAACLSAASQLDVQACVVIEDLQHKTTSGSRNGHEEDVVKVFLERTHHHLQETETEAILLADHPSGGRKAESRFVSNCLENMRNGTEFVSLETIAQVLTGDSKTSRLLQLADVIVGCTLAFVGGEDRYSPPIFTEHIQPLMRSSGSRIGGVGLKLHPDFSYANLYHWLLGDSHLWKGFVGEPLPIRGRPYFNGPHDSSAYPPLS